MGGVSPATPGERRQCLWVKAVWWTTSNTAQSSFPASEGEIPPAQGTFGHVCRRLVVTTGRMPLHLCGGCREAARHPPVSRTAPPQRTICPHCQQCQGREALSWVASRFPSCPHIAVKGLLDKGKGPPLRSVFMPLVRQLKRPLNRAWWRPPLHGWPLCFHFTVPSCLQILFPFYYDKRQMITIASRPFVLYRFLPFPLLSFYIFMYFLSMNFSQSLNYWSPFLMSRFLGRKGSRCFTSTYKSVGNWSAPTDESMNFKCKGHPQWTSILFVSSHLSTQISNSSGTQEQLLSLPFAWKRDKTQQTGAQEESIWSILIFDKQDPFRTIK